MERQMDFVMQHVHKELLQTIKLTFVQRFVLTLHQIKFSMDKIRPINALKYAMQIIMPIIKIIIAKMIHTTVH